GMTLIMVAANTQNQAVGASRAERAALFWNETASWGTVYLSPFQSQVSFRFGTTQVGNFPLYNRPSSIGSGFSISTSMKDGTTDSLYVNGVLALSEGGKLSNISSCRSLLNIGRGYNDNTFFAGDIAEVFVYKRALTPSERMTVENYLTIKYFGCTPP